MSEVLPPFFEWKEFRLRLVEPIFGVDVMSEISEIERELSRRKLWKPFVEFEECFVKRVFTLHDVSTFKAFMQRAGAIEGVDYSYGRDQKGYWVAVKVPISEQAKEGWSRAVVYRVFEDAVFEAVRRNLKEGRLMVEGFMESLAGHLLRFKFKKVRFVRMEPGKLEELASEGFRIRLCSVSTIGCGFRVNFFTATKGDLTIFILPVRVVRHEA